MKRSDPRTITYLFVFLVIYVLITGTLVLILRSFLLEERSAELVDRIDRASLLEETVSARAEQEREIIRELIAMSGARDFEEAYVLLREEIANLTGRYARIEQEATLERDARIALDAQRLDAISRVQALALEVERLEANLNACLALVPS